MEAGGGGGDEPSSAFGDGYEEQQRINMGCEARSPRLQNALLTSEGAGDMGIEGSDHILTSPITPLVATHVPLPSLSLLKVTGSTCATALPSCAFGRSEYS